jgi:ribosomal protein L7/L12
MKQGDSYAVYFADFNHIERSKEILSVELVENIGSSPFPKTSPSDDVETVELVKKGHLLEAIRLHRSIHGTSLEEARAMVEDIRMRQ